jgi:hypothetical protein
LESTLTLTNVELSGDKEICTIAFANDAEQTRVISFNVFVGGSFHNLKPAHRKTIGKLESLPPSAYVNKTDLYYYITFSTGEPDYLTNILLENSDKKRGSFNRLLSVNGDRNTGMLKSIKIVLNYHDTHDTVPYIGIVALIS